MSSPEMQVTGKQAAEALLKELDRRKALLYRPYRPQAEFHALGASHRERMFFAGNQLGKTLAGGMETSFHLTGYYMDGWEGRVFRKPTVFWFAGPSGELTRDNPQRILFGRPGAWGTGTIPERFILDVKKAKGINDLIDYATIQHISGGISYIISKTYDQGVEKWQGETVTMVWYDEEPPPDVYAEGLTRTNKGGESLDETGITIITATPLKGATEVVNTFYPEPVNDTKAMVQMEIWDVDHYSESAKKAIVDAYPEHERDARARGIPTLGSGKVYPVLQSQIETPHFEVPSTWRQVVGMDFGWDHPTAAVRCAWDREHDAFYVIDCYRQRREVISTHAAAIKAWGPWLPVAWPHDGNKQDEQGNDSKADQYRDQGLRMMADFAQFEMGGFRVDPGVQELLLAMKTGRFKVFSHLMDWFSEFNGYHRKDGKIVDVRDDLMDATRYAWMMRRYATTEIRPTYPRVAAAYDPYSDGPMADKQREVPPWLQ